MTRIDRAEASLLSYQLEKPVGGSDVASVDVIVVDLTDADGATGLGSSYVIGEVVLAAARCGLSQFTGAVDSVPDNLPWKQLRRRLRGPAAASPQSNRGFE